MYFLALQGTGNIITTLAPQTVVMPNQGNTVDGQQIQQQQQQQQSSNLQQTQQQMNLKTKTALANMLNNRLGGTVASNNTMHIQTQIGGMPQQQTLIQQQSVQMQDRNQQSQQQPQIIQQTQVVVAGPQQQQQQQQTQQQIIMGQQQQLTQQGVINTIATPQQVVEASAAGTLRMMTQQHNAATLQQPPPNQVGSTPVGSAVSGVVGVPRSQQELLLLQQQQQQQQQMRRPILQTQMSTTGPVAANNVIAAGLPPQQQQQQQQIVQQQLVVAAGGGTIQQQVVAAPGTAGPGGVMTPAGYIQQGRVTQLPMPPRPQFYGHNPNLKLPPDLFLVGCTFYIVEEYEETDGEELPIWMETIRQFGGDIEKNYCPRVTHVLCRTQRHGVVMQALRDAKRCITAYWLSDICLKKSLLPPWQPLHLPFPSQFGYQKPLERHIIASNGYEPEEEHRIKQMVQECGAIYTSYLSKLNTVLVCKKLEGDMFNAAKDWNIPVVNSLWLSDITIGNLSSMSQYDNQKYQQYNITAPFRIDYGLVPHLMGKFLLKEKSEKHKVRYYRCFCTVRHLYVS